MIDWLDCDTDKKLEKSDWSFLSSFISCYLNMLIIMRI